MKTTFGAILAIGALSLTSHAHALMLSPTTGTLNVDRFETDDNTNLNSLADICTAFGISPCTLTTATDQYKFNTESPGTEEGPLSGSYEVDNVQGGAGNESGLDINYISGNAVDCSIECFLIVKDGSATPAQYLFILSSINDIPVWNGTDELELSGFWATSTGAISNVALWGGTKTPPPDEPVPAAATLALLGLGLLGLGMRRRNRR